MITRVVLLLLAGLGLAVAQVKFTHLPQSLQVEIDGKPFTEFYFAGPATTKPYLHPLRSASGIRITRLFPMEAVAGEPQDHLHHRGLWFSHGDVNGIDFWANESSYAAPKQTNLGRIVMKKIVSLQGGEKSGAAEIIFDWEGPAHKVLLTEDRTMTFYAGPAMRTIDFDIRLTAREAIKFGDTKEGSFAMRLRPEFDDKHGGQVRNAEGGEGEKKIWGKRSNWVDYSAEVEGEKLSVAIFDHPQNPNHPTRWHARGYALFAANPFGLVDFEKGTTEKGGLTVDAGKDIHFRYRVVIFTPGVDIAKMYSDYTSGK